MLKAGVGLVDITPEKGLELGGYPHYPRNNTGAHDPLYGACMYLNNGETEVVMVTLDLLFFSKKHVTEVRRRVEAKCGIPGNRIMISCSHTHSGPWAAGRKDLESLLKGVGQPMEYVNSLIDKLVHIITEAKANAFEASFCAGTAICGAESGVGGNRRVRGGPHDPLVSVMAVKDRDDVIRGMFVNYSLHPTFIHEWSTVCTADYPGYIRMQVGELAPKAVFGFAQGASGNQSSRYYRQGESYDEAERVGRTIGKAAFSVLETATWKSELDMRVANRSIELEIRQFESEEVVEAKVAEAKKEYEELYAKYGNSTNREEYYLWQNANLKYLGVEDQLGFIKYLNSGRPLEVLTDEAPVEIHVIRLGDTCVIGTPGELFVEYALYVKAMAGFGTVIYNELSNGTLPGYCYTPESLFFGGYETGNSMLHEKFGRHLVDAILDTVETVK